MLSIACRVSVCLITGLFLLLAAGPSVKAGIVTGILRGVAAKAKMDTARFDLVTLGNCLEMYKLNTGVYPTTGQGLKALVEKPAIEPVPRGWVRIMDKVLVDPWGHPYQYQFPGTKDPAKYELSSPGRDGVAGTADDIRRNE